MWAKLKSDLFYDIVKNFLLTVLTLGFGLFCSLALYTAVTGDTKWSQVLANRMVRFVADFGADPAPPVAVSVAAVKAPAGGPVTPEAPAPAQAAANAPAPKSETPEQPRPSEPTAPPVAVTWAPVAVTPAPAPNPPEAAVPDGSKREVVSQPVSPRPDPEKPKSPPENSFRTRKPTPSLALSRQEKPTESSPAPPPERVASDGDRVPSGRTKAPEPEPVVSPPVEDPAPIFVRPPSAPLVPSVMRVHVLIGPGILRDEEGLPSGNTLNAFNADESVRVVQARGNLVKIQSLSPGRGGWLTRQEVTEHLTPIPEEVSQ